MHWSFLGSTGRWFDAADPFAPLNWYNAIGAVGCVLWMVAYVLIIRQGWRDKAYGMPMLALCLNITWEAVSFCYAKREVPLWTWIEGIWLAIDGVILWQFVRFGRDGANAALPPSLRHLFFPLLVLTLAGCFIGHYTWMKFWDDTLLFVDAFLINLIMSALFIQLWFKRLPRSAGLSLGAAWCKMLGTAFTSVQCGIFLPKVMASTTLTRESWAFTWFLYGSIFILDCLYIYLLIHGRRVLQQSKS